MLTRKQKYDYHDMDPWELKLIRVGHALWAVLRRERRQIGYPVSEELALYAAIETIVHLKHEKRAEVKAERAARADEVRERFRSVA